MNVEMKQKIFELEAKIASHVDVGKLGQGDIGKFEKNPLDEKVKELENSLKIL